MSQCYIKDYRTINYYIGCIITNSTLTTSSSKNVIYPNPHQNANYRYFIVHILTQRHLLSYLIHVLSDLLNDMVFNKKLIFESSMIVTSGCLGLCHCANCPKKAQ